MVPPPSVVPLAFTAFNLLISRRLVLWVWLLCGCGEVTCIGAVCVWGMEEQQTLVCGCEVHVHIDEKQMIGVELRVCLRDG